MNDAEKAYQYFVIAVPENEEQAKAYFWARKALQPTLTPPNEWVSVENALPPNMDDVLVVVQNNGECWTVTGYYSNTSNVWYAMLNGQDTKMDVLWWMPLPAPPTKEE
jgi:hypothetical protein